MTHPTEATLTIAAAGDLPESERAALDAHLAGCATCRATHLRLVAARDALAALPAPAADASFSARLQERLDRKPAPRLLPLALGGVVLAAAVVMLVPRAPASEGFQARGSGSPLAFVFFAHPGSAADRRIMLSGGDHVRVGDGLSIETTGDSAGNRYVLAFLRDASGEVHWLAPAWIEAASKPVSVPLAEVASKKLPGVTPEAPAVGPASLCTVVSDRPLEVVEVDSRIKSMGPDAVDGARCGPLTIDP